MNFYGQPCAVYVSRMIIKDVKTIFLVRDLSMFHPLVVKHLISSLFKISASMYKARKRRYSLEWRFRKWGRPHSPE